MVWGSDSGIGRGVFVALTDALGDEATLTRMVALMVMVMSSW